MLNFELFSRYGQTLSAQQQLNVTSSIPTLKLDYRLPHVVFWGRINGLKNDYLLCRGFKDALTSIFFFSIDGLEWAELPDYCPAVAEMVMLFRQPFMGDPSFQYKTDDEDGFSFSEAQRLAAIVDLIANDTSVVPRRAYKKSVEGTVVKNKLYEGLPPQHCTDLSHFMHLRPISTDITDPNTIAEKGLDLVFDCLESIKDDIPHGCWAVEKFETESLVGLRSLLWLGYVFFASFEEPFYTGAYFGDGIYNNDILFMLN
ncbi:hypothetical protein P9112_000620 [Eukaryota sp. TZLM1-RC]